MTALFAPTIWLSAYVMRYLAFPGWIMTLSKCQDGYLNQRVIWFRLQYETHSPQMHPKSPCRSVVVPTPNLLERRYALRLVVVPCRYLPILLPFFQPISPYPSSHISSIAILHLLLLRIHTCCPTSLPPWSYASVLTTDLVWHPHYLASPPRLRCHPPASLLRFSLHYLSLYHVIHHRCLSTFSDRIFSLPVSIFTTLLDPLYSTLLFSFSTIILSLRFLFLFWNGSSLSLWCSRFAPICRVFLHLTSLWSAPIW